MPFVAVRRDLGLDHRCADAGVDGHTVPCGQPASLSMDGCVASAGAERWCGSETQPPALWKPNGAATPSGTNLSATSAQCGRWPRTGSALVVSVGVDSVIESGTGPWPPKGAALVSLTDSWAVLGSNLKYKLCGNPLANSGMCETCAVSNCAGSALTCPAQHIPEYISTA